MNQHQIDKVASDVGSQLKASTSRGFNARSGVVWAFTFKDQLPREIHIPDTSIRQQKMEDLVNYISYKLGE